MQLTQRETLIVSLAALTLIVGGGALMLVMPQVEAIQTKRNDLTTLQGEVNTLTLSEQRMQGNIQEYEQKLASLKELETFTYPAGRMDIGVKAFIDQVVRLASQTGNELISLEPTQSAAEGQAAAAPPPPPSTPADDALQGQAGDSLTSDANAVASSAVEAVDPEQAEREAQVKAQVDAKPLPLQEMGYTLQVRGAYAQVHNFLQALRNNPELLDVQSFALENEAGPNREKLDPSTSQEGSRLNPAKPIKLTVKLKLFLMEESVAHFQPPLSTPHQGHSL